MAKKIVRGITDVKTINNQDFDTNNVNDLLSDGQYNYIHRKKGKNEEYHNLTDNIKTISSDNTELLSVTNYNKTTNTALLSPKHDQQKEQVLEAGNSTITIEHAQNTTNEKTKVKVSDELVETINNKQDKLTTGDGLTISNNEISIKPASNGNPLNNGFYMGTLINDNLSSSIISLQTESNRIVQLAFRESGVTSNLMIMRYRFVTDGAASDWKLATIDNEQLLSRLPQKEQLLESTRNTISIHHGTNGTDEKTTVDTNPKKVLEHENLISDSEYITLEHQTGNATTHIQTAALKQELNNLHETKQDKLTAGTGITIQGQTISATGGGTTSTIQYFKGNGFQAYKYVVTKGYDTFVTFTFNCEPKTGLQMDITGGLKNDLEKFVGANITVTNGSLSIKNNGTTMKLINSAYSEELGHYQQGTFTFYKSSTPTPS